MAESNHEKELSPTIRGRLDSLARQRREILSQPAEKALDLILEHPQPTALIQSFPRQDFYLLVNEIGPEDAVPLLAQASDRQREFILDMEIWGKDHFITEGGLRWLQLLLAADPVRLIPWLAEQKTGFLELVLSKSIEIRIRDQDQDPSDFGPGFITYDDVIYFRILDRTGSPEVKADPEDLQARERREAVGELLHRLASWEHSKYQAILLEAMGVIPAESEEAEYRLKGVRLAEEGFLPYEEAVGIYQPLDPRFLGMHFDKRRFTGRDPLRRFHIPDSPAAWVDPGSRFGGALKRIEPGEIFYEVQSELVALCNQVIAADQRHLRDRDELRKAVRKVCGYLSIGLDAAAGETPDAIRAAAIVQRYPLADLFRIGFGRCLDLKWRAERWVNGSWFRKAGLPLTFWDEAWTGVIGGLLLKRPLCFDPEGGEGMYREFERSEDIRRAAGVLSSAMAVDDLLGQVDPRLDDEIPRRTVSYKSLLLTLWASDMLGLSVFAEQSPLAAALALGRFREFFRSLFPDAPVSDGCRRIPQHMKSAFLQWLERSAGMTRDAIGQAVGNVLASLFEALEEEYGRVAADDLDPRFIPHFILKR
jgi:hypothetical protein